jgi:hypothetical protein
MKIATRSLVLAALAAALPLAGAATAAPADAPTVSLGFGRLDRGPEPTIPYVTGTKLVDGAVSVTLPGPARYLGSVGPDNLVLVYADDSAPERVLRVSDGGGLTTIASGAQVSDPHVSTDGTRLALTRGRRAETTVKVVDTTTRAVVARRTFPLGYASVLDVSDDRVVVGAFTAKATGTWSWNTVTGTQRRISARPGYWADITLDRFATFTKDPYQGGCTVLSALSAPRTTIWRSCDQAVQTMSPSGKRMITSYILADGAGPGAVDLRSGRGRLKVTYDAPYVVGTIGWESGRTALLDVAGTRKHAFVRCTGTDCERATAFGPTPLRPAAARPWAHR